MGAAATRGGREQETTAGAVVLSFGSFHAPNRLEVPRESLEKVLHAFREPYPYYQDVLVVGGRTPRSRRRSTSSGPERV